MRAREPSDRITWRKALSRLVPFLLLAAIVTAVPAGDFEEDLRAWRGQREARLRSPGGWLSVAGLFWLGEGSHRIGSAAQSEIFLEGAPPFLAELVREGERVRLRPAPYTGLTLNGEDAGEAWLSTDVDGAPDTLRWSRYTFHLIHRGQRIGLRVRDLEHPARRAFSGIPVYDADPAWRIRARWEPYDPPRTVKTPTVLGTLVDMTCPGAVVFAIDGREARLDAFADSPGDDLFIIFGDATNGHLTYGGGRFLYASPPANGEVMLDFNRAYNPPCVFTDFATCPLPPPGNILQMAVPAGEKVPSDHLAKSRPIVATPAETEVVVAETQGEPAGAATRPDPHPVPAPPRMDLVPGLGQSLTTKHLRFFIDEASLSTSRELVQSLETLWEFYEATVGSLVELRPPGHRVRMFHFTRPERLQTFLGGRNDRTAVYPGVARSLESRYMAFDAEGILGRSDLASLFHGLAHFCSAQSLYSEAEPGSWWVREGLAVYFMQTRFDRDGTFRYGEVRTSEGFILDSSAGGRTAGLLPFAEEPKKHLRRTRGLYRDGKHVPLVELLEHPGNRAWTDAGRRDQAALQAWLLVHFLMHGEDGELRPRFARYLELDRAGNGGPSGFRRVVSSDLEAFEALMYRYARKMR